MEQQRRPWRRGDAPASDWCARMVMARRCPHTREDIVYGLREVGDVGYAKSPFI